MSGLRSPIEVKPAIWGSYFDRCSLKKQTQKNGCQPLFQVHDQEAKRNGCLTCRRQLCHHTVDPISALGLAELALNRDSIDLISTGQSSTRLLSAVHSQVSSLVDDLVWGRTIGCPISCNIDGCLWFDRCDLHAPIPDIPQIGACMPQPDLEDPDTH